METEIIQQLDVIAKNIQALSEPKFIEYIALLISFISVIVSGLAIWFAVQVPKKIADRQDNIALFEKRYECFQLFERCLLLYQDIKNNLDMTIIETECYYVIDEIGMEDIDLSIIFTKIKNVEFILHQMHFLFPEISENDLANLYIKLQEFIFSVILRNKDIDIKNDDSINVKKRSYLDIMDEFTEKYLHIIWDYMRI